MEMFVALSTLAWAKENGTEATEDATVKLLNYYTTDPYAMVQYKASNIILDIHSETSYLSDPKTHSSAGDTSFWKKMSKTND